MTAETLHDALTLLPADLVATADRHRGTRKSPIPRKHLTAMVACLALVLCSGWFFTNLFAAKGGSGSPSFDKITAAQAPAAAAPMEAAPREESAMDSNAEAESGTSPAENEAESTILFIPNLTLRWDGESLDIPCFSCTWEIPQADGTSQGICIDAPLPTQTKELPLLEVSGDTVTLEWYIQPDSVRFHCWTAGDAGWVPAMLEGGNELFPDSDGIYRLDVHPGTCLYELILTSSQGRASYAFQITTPAEHEHP